VPTLRALAGSAHEVTGVVTQPDRPRGRGLRVHPEAVKLAAMDLGLPVLQPERLRVAEVMDQIRALAPDLAVVAAYGKILAQDLIDLPRLGIINVHASLLPRWRGAAPVHRAILAGDSHTGVTIMRVVRALDAGPMLASVGTAIDPAETSAELEQRLAELGAPLLVETVDRIAAGPVEETPQKESSVTYAHRLERRESRIDWARPAPAVHNQVRGLHPWPLAAGMFLGERTTLLRTTIAHETPLDVPPGTVARVDREAFEVATQPGALRIVELQVAGRQPVSAEAFLRGRPVRTGGVFGPLPDAPSP
jgi:methionyl-tRNA formyltransferase